MTGETISRPFIRSPARPWSHRIATKLFRACRRWQLGDNEGMLEQQHPVVIASSQHNDDRASPIKLVCVSDTHNSKPELPEGDILVHAGDMSQYGTFDEIQAQLSWLAAQTHKHKIVVAGNHDLLLDKAFVEAHPDRELDCHPGKRRADLNWGDIQYLQHSSVRVKVVSGTTSRVLHIFGSPWTPRMGSWAFQYEPNSSFTWKGAIPRDADVIVVHGPPAEHLDDGGKGCKDLLFEPGRVRSRVVVCGHIHAGRGHELLLFDRVQEWYDDVALRRGNWLLSIVMLSIYTSWLAMMSLISRPRDARFGDPGGEVQPTWLVNAAITGSHGNKQERLPYIALI